MISINDAAYRSPHALTAPLPRHWTKRHAQTVAAMLLLKEDTTGPVVSEIGLWLVREARQLWPKFAGLRWFVKTNAKRDWLIASMHHPAALCWAWGLSIEFFPEFCWRQFRLLYCPFRYGQASFVVPGLFRIRYSRQPYDWMLSTAGRERLRAAIEAVQG